MRGRVLATAAAGSLPAGRGKNALLRLLGHRVHRSARIGPVLLVRVGRLQVGAGAQIGPMNVIRDLRSFELGDGAMVGQWNWFSAATPLVERFGGPTAGRFRLGREAALTSRHYVDCSGGVAIGDLTTVAGVRSTFLTHGIRWRAGAQSVGPITIGRLCLISSNVAIAPGTTIPDRSVVGMGATVAGEHVEEATLLVAPRAVPVKRGLVGRYFERLRGPAD